MAEEVDTSVLLDNSSDADDDVSLEDIEVSEADITSGDDDEVEESTESDDQEDGVEEDEPDEDESQESNEEATDDETESSDEQARKEEARQRYEQRQQEKQAREARIRDAQQQYVAEAAQSEDPLAAAVRQLEVDAYNNTVERNAATVTNQYNKALNDFPVLQSNDPVIQAEINQTIDAFQALHVTIDQFGNPYDIRGDLYAALQAKADSIEKLTGIKATKQSESKAKERSKTLTTPTRAPKAPKNDPDLLAFDEEANR